MKYKSRVIRTTLSLNLSRNIYCCVASGQVFCAYLIPPCFNSAKTCNTIMLCASWKKILSCVAGCSGSTKAILGDVTVLGASCYADSINRHRKTIRVFNSAAEAWDCSVVNVSSVQAHRAQPGLHSGWTYQASKGAVTAMTKCMALDLSANGIRVNSVSPGYVWTELVISIFYMSLDQI